MTLYCAHRSYCLCPSSSIRDGEHWQHVGRGHLVGATEYRAFGHLASRGRKGGLRKRPFCGREKQFLPHNVKACCGQSTNTGCQSVSQYRRVQRLVCTSARSYVCLCMAECPGARVSWYRGSSDTGHSFDGLIGDNNEDTGLLMRDLTILHIGGWLDEQLDDKQPSVHFTKYLITDCPKFS